MERTALLLLAMLALGCGPAAAPLAAPVALPDANVDRRLADLEQQLAALTADVARQQRHLDALAQLAPALAKYCRMADHVAALRANPEAVRVPSLPPFDDFFERELIKAKPHR